MLVAFDVCNGDIIVSRPCGIPVVVVVVVVELLDGTDSGECMARLSFEKLAFMTRSIRLATLSPPCVGPPLLDKLKLNAGFVCADV